MALGERKWFVGRKIGFVLCPDVFVVCEFVFVRLNNFATSSTYLPT